MQQKTFEMFLFSVGAETFAVKVKLRKSTHFFLHTQIVDKRFFFFFFLFCQVQKRWRKMRFRDKHTHRKHKMRYL